MAEDPVTFEAFHRKWRYIFAYAAAGLVHGYLGCHMFTFIRTVCRPSDSGYNSLLTQDGTSITKALSAERHQEDHHHQK